MWLRFFTKFKVAGSPIEALLRAPALRLTGRASTFKIFPEDFIGDDMFGLGFYGLQGLGSLVVVLGDDDGCLVVFLCG